MMESSCSKKNISIVKRNNKKKKNYCLNLQVCEKKDFWNVTMPSEDTEILEFNQLQKSDKAPFIIQAFFWNV